MNISSFFIDAVSTNKVNSIIKSIDANKAPGTAKNTNETHHFRM